MIGQLTPLFKQAAADLAKPRISNFLTLGRIAITPFMVMSILHQQWLWALVLLLVAGITDVLDVYFARLLGEESMLGKYLDPLADKIFLVASIAAMAYVDVPSLNIPWWFAVFITLREVIMIAGAVAMAVFGQTQDVKPTIYGKLTTFFLILFIAWLIVCYLFSWRPEVTYSFALGLLVIVSFFSLLHYAKIAIQLLSTKENK